MALRRFTSSGVRAAAHRARMTMMASTCPYCCQPTQPVTGAIVYPHREDLADKQYVMCEPCNAYVGCHPDGTPMGPVADGELRAARHAAHDAFNPLIARKMAKDRVSKAHATGEGYKWLSMQLGIPTAECHIARFDVVTCQRVVDLCRPTSRRGAPIQQKID